MTSRQLKRLLTPTALHGVGLFAALLVAALAPTPIAVLGCFYIPAVAALNLGLKRRDAGYDRLFFGNNRCILHVGHAVLVGVFIHERAPEVSLVPLALTTCFGVFRHLWTFGVFHVLEKRNLPVYGGPHPHKYVGYIRDIPRFKKNASTSVWVGEALVALPALEVAARGRSELAWPAALLAILAILVPFVRRMHVARQIHLHVDSGLYLARLKRTLFRVQPEVVLHFGGTPNIFYQAQMWIDAMLALDQQVLLVVRKRAALGKAVATGLPSLFVHSENDIEYLMPSSLRVALFPGNNASNLTLVRLPHVRSVFVGHGDSDKAASANQVTRMYHRVFVAGQAAIDRYVRAKVGIEPHAFEIVGRPQLSHVTGPRPRGQGKLCILYAPTWEGWTEETNYTSLSLFRERMTGLMDAFPEATILFRPHPYTGHHLPSYRKVQEEICALMRERGHNARLGSTLTLYECFNRSDILISDISSVVNDYLASGKPIVLSNPKDIALPEYIAQFAVARACYVLDAAGERLVELARVALNEDPMEQERANVAEYTLGGLAESSSTRFQSAITRLHQEALRDFPLEFTGSELTWREELCAANERRMRRASSNDGGASNEGKLLIRAPVGHVQPDYFAAGDIIEVLKVEKTPRGPVHPMLAPGGRVTLVDARYLSAAHAYVLDFGSEAWPMPLSKYRFRVLRAGSEQVIFGPPRPAGSQEAARPTQEPEASEPQAQPADATRSVGGA